ncbi:MAG: M23 family metallopeptidase [bacterium]
MKSKRLLSGLVIIFTFNLWGCVQEPYLRGGEPGVYHPVKPGETLWRIAKAYQVSLKEILESNHIPDPIHLEVGERIFIPGASKVLMVNLYQPLSSEEPVDTKEGIYHTVKPGETMWRIAKTYGVSLDYLLQVNQISDVAFVEVGREIFIPGAQKALDIELPRPSLLVTGTEAEISFAWPLKGEIISGFGPRNDGLHKGIDINAPAGTEIKAAARGKAVYCGDDMRGYGKIIILEHEAGFSTVYAHNSENLVQEGEEVEKGQLIGRVGATGRATSPHLHFEIRKDGQARDPMIYLS